MSFICFFSLSNQFLNAREAKCDHGRFLKLAYSDLDISVYFH